MKIYFKLRRNNNAARLLKSCAAVVVCLLAVSCSTTKRIPEGEQLYIGVKKLDIKAVEGETVPASVEQQLTSAVSVPPNNAIFKSAKYRMPFPVGLWVYNNWEKRAETLAV